MKAHLVCKKSAAAFTADGVHILAIKPDDSEQQLGNHMEPNGHGILKNSHCAWTFDTLTPTQTRAEEKRKSIFFFSTDC